MAKVRLYHSELQSEITVEEDAAWVHLENGWKPAEAQPESAPVYDTAGPPVPAEPSLEPEAETPPEPVEESKGGFWGKHSKE